MEVHAVQVRNPMMGHTKELTLTQQPTHPLNIKACTVCHAPSVTASCLTGVKGAKLRMC